jgi:hypothetical protein
MMTRSIAVVSVVVVGLVLVYLSIMHLRLASVDENNSKMEQRVVNGTSDEQKGRFNSRTRNRERQVEIKNQTADRQKLLEKLKRQWDELGPRLSNIDDFADREELGRLSVRQLMFSAEFFDLEQYLAEKGILTDRRGGGLWVFLYDGLKSDVADDLKESYLEFVSREDSAGGDRLRLESFADHIGRSTTPDGFNEFYERLYSREPLLAQELLFGFSEHQASIDPSNIVEVVGDLVEILGVERKTTGSPQALVRVIQYVNGDSDFHAIDKALDSAEAMSQHINLEGARKELVFRWATINPEEAARKVMDGSGKYPASVMEFVGSVGFGVIEKRAGSNAAIEWIQSIPGGELRNRTIYGAARSCYLDDPAKALRIASLMPSEDREVYFKMLSPLK